MKKNLIPLLLLCCFVACHPTHDEVVLTFDNGKPELVYQVKGKGDQRSIVGERMYYDNGQLRMEKHFAAKDKVPTGTWRYLYDDGKPFAQGDFDATHPNGTHWQFFTHEGVDYFDKPYDSLVVTTLSTKQIPAEVHCYRGDSVECCHFYENYALQLQGLEVASQRQGRWTTFYPTGARQVEVFFDGGVEHGTYSCFRENGIPYCVGSYDHGERTGVWEFYDPEGNLSGTKDFSH